MQEEIIGHLWIIIPLLILLGGEFIPFTNLLWEKVGINIKKIGEWFIKNYEYRLYKTKKEWLESKTQKIQLKNFFARILFFIVATIIVVFLELFWEMGFKKTSEKLESSKFANWFQMKVKSWNKYVVLALFGIPFIVMETIGIFAAGFLMTGHIWIFIGLYMIKFLFFIPVHFILHIGEEKLMSIVWFKRRYDIIISVLEWFKKSQTYTRVHNFSENIGSYVRGFKNLFTNSVTNMDKAFKGEDLLSSECEAIRLEISNMNKPSLDDYKKFFDCINKHIINV